MRATNRFLLLALSAVLSAITTETSGGPSLSITEHYRAKPVG